MGDRNRKTNYMCDRAHITHFCRNLSNERETKFWQKASTNMIRIRTQNWTLVRLLQNGLDSSVTAKRLLNMEKMMSKDQKKMISIQSFQYYWVRQKTKQSKRDLNLLKVCSSHCSRNIVNSRKANCSRDSVPSTKRE